IDFDRSVLVGSATLTGSALKDDVATFTVDTNHLVIKGVSVDQGLGFAAAEYTLSEAHPVFGHALNVSLKDAKKDAEFKVKIEYETTKESAGIQVLTPEQTLGKKHPFLFTQCQAIHARSLLPCQDSPSIKLSYSADIR
ncbi:Leukotriene A-4 hydrolase, partial [Linderina pennispora]